MREGLFLLGCAAIAVSACSHAAPAAGGVSCTLAAASNGPVDAGACDVVLARVRAAGPVVGNATIALDLSRPGSAIARVRTDDAAGGTSIPEIAVDVMDRPLRASDLVRLGDAIAAALSAPHSGASAR